MQRVLREGNSLAFRKQKSESVRDWGNAKSIQPACLRYESDISKCKRSLFARYHTPLTLLPSNSLERYADARTASDIIVLSQLSTLKHNFYRTKIILATGILILSGRAT